MAEDRIVQLREVRPLVDCCYVPELPYRYRKPDGEPGDIILLPACPGVGYCLIEGHRQELICDHILCQPSYEVRCGSLGRLVSG